MVVREQSLAEQDSNIEKGDIGTPTTGPGNVQGPHVAVLDSQKEDESQDTSKGNSDGAKRNKKKTPTVPGGPVGSVFSEQADSNVTSALKDRAQEQSGGNGPTRKMNLALIGAIAFLAYNYL
jgi:hypothetical protein